MKGIILAGGAGTRLYPATKAISKQILPIYDKPMIYYSLSVLMMAGIKDILIISTPRDIGLFEQLLSDGSQLGINITYAIQNEPKGIAQAFIVGEKFIENDSVALILGDNIFYGYKMEEILLQSVNNLDGATIFAYYVNNPEEFGIVEFDENGNVISIEEKPKTPKSNFAVPGLYFYDNKVIDIAKGIKPSKRGELEITAVNDMYLKNKKLKVKILSRGIAWLDTGTYHNLIKAGEVVDIIQNTMGIYIGCIEEIAYKKGYIDISQFKMLIEDTVGKEYKEYLNRCLYNN